MAAVHPLFIPCRHLRGFPCNASCQALQFSLRLVSTVISSRSEVGVVIKAILILRKSKYGKSCYTLKKVIDALGTLLTELSLLFREHRQTHVQLIRDKKVQEARVRIL